MRLELLNYLQSLLASVYQNTTNIPLTLNEFDISKIPLASVYLSSEQYGRTEFSEQTISYTVEIIDKITLFEARLELFLYYLERAFVNTAIFYVERIEYEYVNNDIIIIKVYILTKYVRR